MRKKTKLPITKEISCSNCDHPFTGHEVFCPQCGQKTNNVKVTFGNFIREVFASFFSWDAKFWRTLFPLLFKPGNVSKDYIEGKRARYTNPFRFYITMSILFFLVLGLEQTYNKYKSLNTINEIAIKKGDNKQTIQEKFLTELENASKKTDSLKQIIKNDSLKNKKDSIAIQNQLNSFKLLFAKENNEENITTFLRFQKNNPNTSVDSALDSLKIEKSFSNRFWYSRSKIINSFLTDNDEQKKFNSHLISYFSIALLILLPILSFFLKILYIRRGYTYVEHLVFTFHVQTVCFIVLTLFFIIRFFTSLDTINIIQLFSILLGVYLYLAMKRFYKQGWIKTLFKFLSINFIFSMLLVITIVFISVIGFALY